MKLKKYGYRMRASLEMVALLDPSAPRQEGHYEPVAPTKEEIATRQRALAALEELESNPYAIQDCDGGYWIEGLKTEEWVADESHEDWMARVRAWWEGGRS